MRALTVTEFGGPDVLSVLDLPDPEPGPGQVRVRVAGASVHPFDIVIRAGFMGPMLPAGPTYVLGADLAGVVDAVGVGVTGVSVGDPVVAMSNWPETKAGGQAELVVLPEELLARAPSTVDLRDAAALPLNAVTATLALAATGLGGTGTVLVTGAAGGVGGFAIELARHAGLEVVGVAGIDDRGFVESAGAAFLDRSAALDDGPGPVADALVDCAAVGKPAMRLVRDGGVFVSMKPPEAPPAERGIRTELVRAHGVGVQLSELSELVDKGVLSLRTASRAPLADAAAVHTRLQAGGVRGALILTPEVG